MDSEAATMGIRVRDSSGIGVTVVVINLDRSEVFTERAARSWPEVYALADEYGVPQERISVDDEAETVLGEP
jgi:L-rhamnose mutarotase